MNNIKETVDLKTAFGTFKVNVKEIKRPDHKRTIVCVQMKEGGFRGYGLIGRLENKSPFFNSGKYAGVLYNLFDTQYDKYEFKVDYKAKATYHEEEKEEYDYEKTKKIALMRLKIKINNHIYRHYMKLRKDLLKLVRAVEEQGLDRIIEDNVATEKYIHELGNF